MATSPAAALAAVYLGLFVAHQIGDWWLQTHAQACAKGRPGWSGRFAGLRHVAVLTATKGAVLGALWALLHLGLHPWAVAAGLGIDAASHWWADRRTTLRALAQLMDRVGPFGKTQFYDQGGALHLDQAWHMAWLLVAAVIAIR